MLKMREEDLEFQVWQLKMMAKKDSLIDHIIIPDSALLQLALLIEKNNPKPEDALRFYVMGYLTGKLQQKWSDEGLDINQKVDYKKEAEDE